MHGSVCKPIPDWTSCQRSCMQTSNASVLVFRANTPIQSCKNKSTIVSQAFKPGKVCWKSCVPPDCPFVGIDGYCLITWVDLDVMKNLVSVPGIQGVLVQLWAWGMRLDQGFVLYSCHLGIEQIFFSYGEPECVKRHAESCPCIDSRNPSSPPYRTYKGVYKARP